MPVTVRVSSLLLALLLSLVTCSALRAADAEWIWPHSSPKDSDRVFFRKVIDLPADVKKAQVATTCDNMMTLFVNGERVVESLDWMTPTYEDITKRLHKGENIIAVRGINAGGIAAMVLRLDIETTDGKKQTIVTDGSWLSSADEVEGWQKLEFDASKWKKPHSFGKLGVAPWNEVVLVPGDRPKAQSTPLGSISALPDFNVELLYSVPKAEQGSWVNMTTDDKGRLIVSDQGGAGLYRITPGKDADSTKVEKLTVKISEAQGLLYVPENKTLYVVVNGGSAQGSGLYAVRDTDGDDQFDEVKLMKRINGGGEHGPHAVIRGPNGKLYIISGNHTQIPEGCVASSPHRNYAEDHLLPRNPDGNGHATGVMAPGGWVAITDLEGKEWELFCAGFRNEYDIAFNQDGELFSYDADMEWDTGAPWYRPTRVNHAVSAAEFGWRFGTGKWPEYYVDSLGAVANIGLGSPTGIAFGTGAKFPAKYQRALYICDWTYGKLYAVHMQPEGASYTSEFEVFVSGRPLPLTDVVINPVDGAMYFTVGGRGTQSGLYRVTYTGTESTAPVGAIENADAKKARETRLAIEKFHHGEDAKAIETAWPYLSSSDRNLRYAARVAIERQPLASWKDKALAEKNTTAKIQAMVALARSNDKALQGDVIAKLNELPLDRMTEEQVLDALRAYGLAFIRLGGKTDATAKSVIEKLNPLLPGQSELINHELASLLIYLDAPGVVERGMQLLSSAQTQQDQMYYAFVLRNAANGWTDATRNAYFGWLSLAENKYRGGASFRNFIKQIRNDSVAKMTDADREKFKQAIAGSPSTDVVKLETTRQFIHNWQISDIEPLLVDVEKGRNFERGRAAFAAAQCAKCHRFDGEGGSTGPDITGVGSRFDAKYILEAMVLPSKVVSDQYINHTLYTEDGEVIAGRIIEDDGKIVRIRTNPFELKLAEIPSAKIEEKVPSKVSEMPQGLINVLEKDEILDLIAYLRSAGKKDDVAFQK